MGAGTEREPQQDFPTLAAGGDRYNGAERITGGEYVRAYGFRWPVVLASMVAVLAILFGAQMMYARQTLALPLNNRLAATPGVVGQPTVTTDALGLVVDVRLGLVSDLQSTYHRLLTVAAQGAGGRHVALNIEDSRTPQLSQDFMTLSAILDQGRATGQFVAMERQFAAASAGMQLTRALVTFDSTQMYVELVSGAHYLYAIMPLTLTTGTGAAA